uniref:Ig-like domain-containing protein n=1 Tax=Lates calcarifer TaxID=8187 RepID=A0A4W6FA08_LATCA
SYGTYTLCICLCLLLFTALFNVFSGCTGKQIELKTVRVGDDVHLTCPRIGSGTLFWIRLVSGNLPKILGKTYSYEPDPRITATEGHGTFDLHIGKAKLSDAAVYYCVKTQQGELIFLEGTDLRVEGPQPVTTAIPTSDPVHTEDSVTLQCSVLSDSENKTHLEEKYMCCFRAGSHQSLPSFNYTQGDSVYENKTNPEGVSTNKCIHSFLKNISCSDAGTYHCAVAKCGERFSDKRSNLTTEGKCIIFPYNKKNNYFCF